MDSERVRFVFGRHDIDSDLSDRHERDQALEHHFIRLSPIDGALRQVLANQILDNNPPGVWSAVVRLRSEGRSDKHIWRELCTRLTGHIRATLEGDIIDVPAYAAALGRPPLPEREKMFEAFAATALATPGISVKAALDRVVESVGLDESNATDRSHVETAFDHALDAGVVDFIHTDRLVSVAGLANGVTLTHTLTAEEIIDDSLDLCFDLALFVQAGTVTHDGNVVTVSQHDNHHAYLDGVLAGFGVGETLAVTLQGESLTTRSIAPPRCDPALVELVRTTYDRGFDSHDMPVSGRELLVEMRFARPDLFTEPAAPLADLVQAAGLEIRCHEVGHNHEPWRNASGLKRYGRLSRRFDNKLDMNAVARAMETADRVGDDSDGTDDAEASRFGPAEVARLRIPDVFDCLRYELATVDGDRRAATQRLADIITDLSHHRSDRAMAEHLRSDAAFDRNDTLAALSHIRQAVEHDAGWKPGADRLGLFAFVQGDGQQALRLWRNIPQRQPICQTLTTIMASGSGPSVGRNAPCPCGSGRKFKQCHQLKPSAPTATAEANWLWSKAICALTSDPVVWPELATIMSILEPEGMESGYNDAVAIDLALHEEECELTFLEDWGDLLPDGERTLLESWSRLDRSFYEIVSRNPLVLRSRVTGEIVGIADSPFATFRTGAGFCARVVPDRDGGAQLLPGGFLVDPDDEDELLEILQEHDGYEIASWLAERDD